MDHELREERAEAAIAKIEGHLEAEYGINIERPPSGELNIEDILAQARKAARPRCFTWSQTDTGTPSVRNNLEAS